MRVLVLTWEDPRGQRSSAFVRVADAAPILSAPEETFLDMLQGHSGARLVVVEEHRSMLFPGVAQATPHGRVDDRLQLIFDCEDTSPGRLVLPAPTVNLLDSTGLKFDPGSVAGDALIAACVGVVRGPSGSPLADILRGNLCGVKIGRTRPEED